VCVISHLHSDDVFKREKNKEEKKKGEREKK
jgi:hypothetical protein